VKNINENEAIKKELDGLFQRLGNVRAMNLNAEHGLSIYSRFSPNFNMVKKNFETFTEALSNTGNRVSLEILKDEPNLNLIQSNEGIILNLPVGKGQLLIVCEKAQKLDQSLLDNIEIVRSVIKKLDCLS